MQRVDLVVGRLSKSSYRFALARVVSVLACLRALVAVGLAEDGLWQTNFEAAKARAKAEKKLLLVDFTGSDWCGWCIQLRQEVFDKEAFRTGASKQFVLVQLDFPSQKKLPEELKAQNDKLAEQYKIRGFPTVLLLDADGQVVAKTGYRPDGPEKYVKHLAEFVKVYETIGAMRAKLKKAQGLDRAKLLDQLIEAHGKLDNEVDEIEGWGKEIVTLDAENKTGLKAKYQCRFLLAEAAKLKASGKFDDAKAVLDKALALPGLSGEQKQDAHFAQWECFFHRQDFSGVVASLKKALEAAPETPEAANIKAMIRRFAAIADAQQAVPKIKTDLEKAQGIERAKLLDQLLEARAMLSQVVPDTASPQEVEKTFQEIIRLDPENKAGLKHKYEFRAMLAEARHLMEAQKPAEAQALLDKALAIPGLTGDETREAHLVKGAAYWEQRDLPSALACFKKGLAAVPSHPRADVLKHAIETVESELREEKAKEQSKAAEPKKSAAK